MIRMMMMIMMMTMTMMMMMMMMFGIVRGIRLGQEGRGVESQRVFSRVELESTSASSPATMKIEKSEIKGTRKIVDCKNLNLKRIFHEDGKWREFEQSRIGEQKRRRWTEKI